MPNHTQNMVVAKGPRDVVQSLIAAVRTEHDRKEVPCIGGGTRTEDAWVQHFDFNKIIPEPDFIMSGKSLTAEDEDSNPGRNWLDWRRRRWGTKWNSYGMQDPEFGVLFAEFDRENRHRAFAIFYFQTAWSSPDPVLLELAELFPDLEIQAAAICEGYNFAHADAFVVSGDRLNRKVERVRKSIECDEGSVEFQRLYELVYREPLNVEGVES